MRKTVVTLALGVFLALSTVTPAFAAGQGTQIKDAFIACYTSSACGDHTERTPSQDVNFTMGDALSAGFFGNTANLRESGHGVVPATTPGPSGYACHLGCVISTAVTAP